jgi:hypothetical protein
MVAATIHSHPNHPQPQATVHRYPTIGLVLGHSPKILSAGNTASAPTAFGPLQKVQSRLMLNFARKLLQNGVSLWFELVISNTSATSPWDQQATAFLESRTTNRKVLRRRLSQRWSTGSRYTVLPTCIVTRTKNKTLHLKNCHWLIPIATNKSLQKNRNISVLMNPSLEYISNKQIHGDNGSALLF